MKPLPALCLAALAGLAFGVTVTLGLTPTWQAPLAVLLGLFATERVLSAYAAGRTKPPAT